MSRALRLCFRPLSPGGLALAPQTGATLLISQSPEDKPLGCRVGRLSAAPASLAVGSSAAVGSPTAATALAPGMGPGCTA